MRKSFGPSPALRGLCLISLAALMLLAGCDKLHGLYSRKEPGNPHSVTIAWTASKSAVVGYNVYRQSQSDAPIKLTATLVLGTAYVDSTVEAGHTYTYYVTSVDFQGLESSPSEKISATVPTTATPAAKQ